ncbi:MAG: ABC transporter permease [Thermomicrobiales bacterium]
MPAFVLRRLGSLVLTLLLLSIIVFGITQLLPGNVAQMILGPYASEDTQAALEEKLGLNEPLAEQYVAWLGGFVRGDWGESLRLSREIRPILLLRLQNSAYLALSSLIGVAVFGIGLGVIAGVRQNRPADHVISIFAFIGISLPAFVSGSMLIILFAGGVWSILPGSGYTPPSEDVREWLTRLVLPTITLMLLLLAYVIRMTRSSMIEVLSANYIRTARLKGAPERTVVVRHALRNALLPTVTVIAMNIGWILGSVVIVEEIFAYPGVGSLILFSVNNRDLPLLQATVMAVGAVTGLANLAADVAYVYLNPRIRYR